MENMKIGIITLMEILFIGAVVTCGCIVVEEEATSGNGHQYAPTQPDEEEEDYWEEKDRWEKEESVVNIAGNYKIQDVSGDIINIVGNYNEIKILDGDTITITGNYNGVTILNRDISLIRVTGNYNTVYYPKDARPMIKEVGNENEIITY